MGKEDVAYTPWNARLSHHKEEHPMPFTIHRMDIEVTTKDQRKTAMMLPCRRSKIRHKLEPIDKQRRLTDTGILGCSLPRRVGRMDLGVRD